MHDASQSTADISQPTDPDLLQLLLRLQRDDRSAWRCLRTAREVKDFAHLARRLHLNQLQLRHRLQQLEAQLDARHLCMEQSQVCLSMALLIAIDQINSNQAKR